MENPSGSGEKSNIVVSSFNKEQSSIVDPVPVKSVPVILRSANYGSGLSPTSLVLIRPAVRGITRILPPKSIPNPVVPGQKFVRLTPGPRVSTANLETSSILPSVSKAENPGDAAMINEETLTPLSSTLRNTPIYVQLKDPTVPSNSNTTLSSRVPAVDAKKFPIQSSPLHREVTREMQVRVCKRRDRRFSVLRYNSYDRLDLSGGGSDTQSSTRGGSDHEVFLRRENNLRQFKATHSTLDSPSRGAGSEFGQEAKEEARLRRLGVVRQSYNAEEQPWLLTVGKGPTAKRYRGVREGNVSENVRYFIFCQTKDGNFDAYPVHEWYKLNPEVNYRYLRDEEAEAEYTRRHKTLNLFNVMVKRKLTDEPNESGGLEVKDLISKLRTGSLNNSDATLSGGRISTLNSENKAGSASIKPSRSFLLTELDEWGDLVDDEDDEDEEKDTASGEHAEEIREGTSKDQLDDESRSSISETRRKPNDAGKGSKSVALRKKRAAAIVARKRRGTKQRRRRRKTTVGDSSDENEDSNEEAWDESDPDDHEGDEVDYITNSSSDEEKLSADEREQIYQETGVDEEEGLKTLLTDNGDTDAIADEPLLANEEEGLGSASDEEEETVEARKHRTSSYDRSRHHEKSGVNASPRRRRPHSKGGSVDSSSSSSPSSSDASSSSSDDSSDSDMAPDDPIKMSRKAEKKVEMMRKISDKVSAVSVLPLTIPRLPDAENSSKRSIEESGESPLSKRPKLGETTGPGVVGAVATPPVVDDELTAAVRKYLMRKPISVTDLWKKIRMKKLVPKSDDAQTMLANALRQLRPIKQIINGQHVLSLKR